MELRNPCRKSFFHTIYSAQCHAVKAIPNSFCTAGKYACVEAQRSHDLIQESGLLILRFCKCDRNFGSPDRDRNSGEPGSATQVKQGLQPSGQQLGRSDAFNEVSIQYSITVTNRGEVDPGIPLEDQLEIIIESVPLFLRKRFQSCICHK